MGMLGRKEDAAPLARSFRRKSGKKRLPFPQVGKLRAGYKKTGRLFRRPVCLR